jgi:small ligand-binding sensory domain FIST
MASAGRSAGGNSLLKNDRVYKDGMVGVSLSGAIEVEAVVSQGCQPIGKPWVITRSRENVIEQLGGRPAMEVLSEFVEGMNEAEKRQLSGGLLIGRAISEYKEKFGRGDFLIRNISGVSEKMGVFAVNDLVKTGQTVQFHIRDAITAHEDLAQLLSMQPTHAQAAGGLLFSCNGRGTNLFDHSGHDITTSHATMPNTPVAGFFAAGELGPVGGKNFVHGHTASFCLMRGRKG